MCRDSHGGDGLSIMPAMQGLDISSNAFTDMRDDICKWMPAVFGADAAMPKKHSRNGCHAAEIGVDCARLPQCMRDHCISDCS